MADEPPKPRNIEDDKKQSIEEFSIRFRELEEFKAVTSISSTTASLANTIASSSSSSSSSLVSSATLPGSSLTNPTRFSSSSSSSSNEKFTEFTSDNMMMGPLGHTRPAAHTPSPYSDKNNLPFKNPDQNYVLINVAHRHQNPSSMIPKFRICGAFPHKTFDGENMILRHVNEVGGISAYGNVNLFTTEMHKKFLICTSDKKQMDPDYVHKKIEAVTLAYQKHNQYCQNEFEENKKKYKEAQKDPNKVPTLTPQEIKDRLNHRKKIEEESQTARKQLLNKRFNEQKKRGHEAGRISRNAELRYQNFAVVSVIPDLTEPVQKGEEDPEPVVIIWACVDTEDDGKHYIYDTASEKIEDLTLDLFSMYEWISPTELKSNQVEEEYRNPTLSKIMKNRKKQQHAVMEYEKWFEEQKRQVPVIESSFNEHGEQVVTRTDESAHPPVNFKAAVIPKRLNQHDTVITEELLEEFKELPLTNKDEIYNKFEYGIDETEQKTSNRPPLHSRSTLSTTSSAAPSLQPNPSTLLHPSAPSFTLTNSTNNNIKQEMPMEVDNVDNVSTDESPFQFSLPKKPLFQKKII